MQTTARPLALALLLAMAPLAVATTARADEVAPESGPADDDSPLTPEPAPASGGFSHFKKGDISAAAFLGFDLFIPTAGSVAALFAIMADGDYYLTDRLSVGATLGLGFGGHLFTVDVGPQAKFAVFATGPHHVYARAALAFEIFRFFGGGVGVTAVGVNLQVGGGYKYFFNDRFHVGADVALVPTLVFTSPAGFAFGINVNAGAGMKF
jgi:hypothetical protein